MSTVVVFDVETDCSFASLQGMCREQQLKVMQVTVACALELDTDLCAQTGSWEELARNAKKHHWWRDEPEANKVNPFHGLLGLFDAADVIVAYNGLDFDFPVLRKHYGHGKTAFRRYMQHRLKCHDPMARIQAATDVRFKLDVLLKLNGLAGKTADGLQAIRMWESGQRQELLSYCANDVWALAQLVCLWDLEVPVFGKIPNAAFGVASAVHASRRLVNADSMTSVSTDDVCEEDDFVLVEGRGSDGGARDGIEVGDSRPAKTPRSCVATLRVR
jgi:hypothetical protein